MFLIAGLIAVVFTWGWWTYPRTGGLIFDVSIRLEAALYRLKQIPVSIPGMTMATYQGGAAQRPPLLLIHGFSADKNLWLRGDYTIPAQGRRLIQLLDAGEIDKVHVVGSSMGGYIASWLAVNHPDRVLSIALFNPAGVNLPQPNEVEELVAQGKNPFLIRSQAEFDLFFEMTMASPPWIPKVVLAAEAQTYIKRREELAQIWEDFFRSERMDADLKRISAPTLLLLGRADRMIPVASAQTWAEGIPHARLEVWDGVGHLPMIERTDETVALYRAFLTPLTD